MADNVAWTAGSGTTIATDDVAGVHYQKVKLAVGVADSAVVIGHAEDVGHTDGDGGIMALAVRKDTAAALAGTDGDYAPLEVDASGRVHVNVGTVNPGTSSANLGKQEDSAHNSGDTGVLMLGVRNSAHASRTDADGDYTPIAVDAEGCVLVVGNVAHDAGDSDGPIKVGHKAIAHGTNPTAVAAADRTDWYANRAGVPFVMGGHPNIVTLKHTTITTAVTDAAIITIASGLKIVVTRITATLDNASTVYPTVLIGFGATNTPTTTGVLAAHGGVPAGGGFTIGDGSGILGVGADGEDLRVTTTGNATGNGLQICVSYYTIES